MSVRRTRTITSKKCECSKCGIEANSIPNTTHRRCSGSRDKLPREKYDQQLDPSAAGKWV